MPSTESPWRSKLVPGGEGRDLRRFVGRRIAAPYHVQIGPHQDEVVSVNLTRHPIGNVEHPHRRTTPADRGFKAARVLFGAAELEDRIAVGNAILDRRAVIEPNMRQPRARPSGWLIFPE